MSSSWMTSATVDDALRNLEVELLRSQANLEFVSQRLEGCFARSYPDSNPIRLVARLREAQDEAKRMREELDEINLKKDTIMNSVRPTLIRNKERTEQLLVKSGAKTLKEANSHKVMEVSIITSRILRSNFLPRIRHSVPDSLY